MQATPQVDSQEKTGEGAKVITKTADEEGLEAESQITIQGGREDKFEVEFEDETESEGDLESQGMMEEEPEEDVNNIRSVVFR